jgi:1,4-alpha-glucan branching enzyme
MGSGTVIPPPPPASPVSSSNVGMGAVPYNGGVTFRVWAKFAQSVSVTGDFNGWDTTTNSKWPWIRSAMGWRVLRKRPQCGHPAI